MLYAKAKKQAGFTLIEVLVASIILFSSVAIVGVIYKGVIIASEKSENQIYISAVVPESIKIIQKKLRNKQNESSTEESGSVSLLEVDAKWQALLVEAKVPPEYFDPDSGNLTVIDKKYNLWSVDVQFKFKTTIQEYNFYELTWDE
ncbi:prepilin-type N-terminal cleavage/methylation domain-containing protein [Pseudoalteromonas sp. TB64]|uniref:prepilin-type N-terminal cleavage/methylation domain-containing protein n=1 Tax=Pseudoalteromonas sp. TB64 TaxID=1938600 RepID=UPI0004665ED3|nr:prepilin-type N-terminal cleavage/methylation domain-containing protein [Pseudoalteromonas sp. TB64]